MDTDFLEQCKVYGLGCIQDTWESVFANKEKSLVRFEDFTQRFLMCVQKASLVVDVGAEFGFYSFLALREMPKTGRIHAFEADPSRHAAMQDFLDIHTAYKDRIIFENKAISGKVGELTLHKPHTVELSSSIDTAYFEKQYGAADFSYSVPCTTLDNVFGDQKIDVLKMDIEGAEVFAFAGMEKILAARHTHIFIEMHDTQVEALSSGGMEAMAKTLKKYGYTCYLCNGLTLTETDLKGGRIYCAPPEASLTQGVKRFWRKIFS